MDSWNRVLWRWLCRRALPAILLVALIALGQGLGAVPTHLLDSWDVSAAKAPAINP